MVEGVEEGRVSFGGTSPMSVHPDAAAATEAAGLNSTSEGRSTLIVEAYRVEEAEETPERGTVYEAELAEPQAVLPFYQRKGYVYAMTAVTTLLAIGIAVAIGVILSNNSGKNTGGATADLGAPVSTTNVTTSTPTTNPTSPPTRTKYIVRRLAEQTLEVKVVSVFTVVQQEVFCSLLTGYTANFGSGVGPQQIITDCAVTQQSLRPSHSVLGRTQRGLQTTGSSVLLTISFTITYETKFGHNIDTYPSEFQNWVNGNLATVTQDMKDRFLPVQEANEVIVFARAHQAKLLKPDGASNDRFGGATAIYQDTIVVGALGDDDKGAYSGSAHIFVGSGSRWLHDVKLLAPGGVAGDEFGSSVAIYGDTIVVGAPGDADSGVWSGSAHVFLRSGSRWLHDVKLLAPDGEAYDRFGFSVAIHEDTIVVGADEDDDNGNYSGSAYVFVRSGEKWSHQAKLLAPDGAAGDHFGGSAAIYGGTIVVGSGGDDNGEDSGSAYVFLRSEEEWTHQTKLLAPDGAAQDQFGRTVAIYQDTIVVGADYDDDNGDNSGSAHVFVRSGEEWSHQVKLLAPDGAAYDWFGNSVALYEDTIVIGARYDDDTGNDSGSAHVFARSGEEWTHQAKLLAPDGSTNDFFGWTVAIFGDTIVVGAWRNDDNGENSGSAHVFVV